MKFVVVKIVRETRPEALAQGHQMRYPDSYDAAAVQMVTRGPHLYDGGIQVFQGDTEELLLIMPDQAVDKWVETDPAHYRKLTVAEAVTWTGKNRALQSQPDEAVNEDGSRRLLLVIARALAKLVPDALEPEDYAALDPNDPTPGVRRVRKRLGDFFPHHVPLVKDTTKE